MEGINNLNNENQELNEEQSQNQGKEDWFEIIKSAVLGFFCAIGEVILGIIFFVGICYWVKEGYDRWFCMDGLEKVGNGGYFYDPVNHSFVNPRPHRRMLDGCLNLEFQEGDTIGVVQFSLNDYRYLNLNNLSFINDMKYNKADLFRNGVAIAISNDSIYRISTNGNVLSSEPSNWIYKSIEEITYFPNDEDCEYDSYEEKSTGVWIYQDVYGNMGLMSSEYVRLTPAIYSSIMAKSIDIFFCEYLDSGLGVLIDSKGNIIK